MECDELRGMKRHNWKKLGRVFYGDWLWCEDCDSEILTSREDEKEQLFRTDCDEIMAYNAARRILGTPEAPKNNVVSR